MEIFTSPIFLSLHSLFFLISLAGFIGLSFRQNRKLKRIIAEQSTTLQRLADSETLLQRMFDIVPVGISLMDTFGNIIDCNGASEQLLGLSKDEHSGRHITSEAWEIYDATGRKIPAEAYASVRALRAQKEIVGQEIEVRKPDGDSVWLSVNATPFLHSRYALLVSYYDITPQKQAEQARLNHQNFLSTLIQTIPDLMWFKDPQGIYLQCNRRFEAFFGRSASGIIGKTDHDFVSASQADLFRHYDQLAMHSGEPVVNQEWVTFAKDGHRELLETTKTAVYNPQKQLIGVLGIGHNITDTHALQEALELTTSSYEELFNSVLESVVIEDAEGRIVAVNKSVTRLLGYEEEWLIHKPIAELAAPRNKNAAQALLRTKAWEGRPQVYTSWLQHINGNVFPVEIHQTSGMWFGQKALFTIMTDISERWSHQQELELIAHYDSLTHLPNRVLLSDRILQAMAQSERTKGLLGVVFLDLDGFKRVNDTYGHAAGDRLLVKLAVRLKAALRKGDTLARIGGDEFVAVILNLESAQAITPILERLLQAAAEPFQWDAVEARVSASLGVTFYPQKHLLDVDQLLRQADQAMYQAKQSGKNRYHIFDPVEDHDIRQHHQDMQRLQEAFENQEFCLYYQPKVNMYTGQVLGAEALIRWQHPERGVLAPVYFLPTLGEGPLSLSLGDWVLESALKQLQQWQAQGLHLSVSVNIQGNHLQSPDFAERLQALLQAHPEISPEDLELEVLETHLIEDLKHTSAIIQKCQELGVQFALDDFGTGYSSLSYLKELPVNTLKIDQSFVRDMLETPEDLSILESTLELAKTFHKHVIVEGVETLAHGRILLQLGSLWGQGYGIGRPMPAEAFEKWCRSWTLPTLWKETYPVAKGLRPLLIAIAEHKAWFQELNHLLKHTAPTEDLKIFDKLCRLHHWFYHTYSTKEAESLLFQEASDHHEKLHQRVQQLFPDILTRSPAEKEEIAQELNKQWQIIEDKLQHWLNQQSNPGISKIL